MDLFIKACGFYDIEKIRDTVYENVFFDYLGYLMSRKLEDKYVLFTDLAVRYSTVLSDFRFKFIPSLKDYTKHLEVKPWMNNALKPIE